MKPISYISAVLLTAFPLVPADAGVILKKVADGFVAPVGLQPYPGDSEKVVVHDQAGVAYLLDGEGGREVFLDVRSKLTKLNEGFDERGLLGLAFHPEFKENGKFYVYYSGKLQEGAPEGWDHTSHLSEFTVKEGAVDESSEKVLLKINQPHFNHNSGSLLFGPEGYLYLSLGDGGAGNGVGLGHAEKGNSQDKTQLLGKVLRLDVNGEAPYGIPKDNPFVEESEARGEIYAMGLRNPWGMAYDKEDDQLILGDVGQTKFEEINVITKGANYGWNVREGFEGFNPKNPAEMDVERPNESEEGKPFTDPVAVYKNRNLFPKDPEGYGISVTGGMIYRGSAVPELAGKYVFGDWARQWGKPEGTLLVADRSGEKWKVSPLKGVGNEDGVIEGYITGFGKDGSNEMYVLTAGQPGFGGETGVIWKIAAGE